VQTDLEAEGYEVQPYVLPAVSVNAPHRRDRVWFVAFKDPNKNGRGGEQRKEKSSIGEFGNISSGDNERIPTDNGETWPTPHPNGNPTGTPGKSTSTTESRSNINVQQSERGSKAELNNRPFAVPRDAADTNRNGLNQRNGNDEEQSGKGWFNALSNPDTGNEYGNVADTNNQLCERGSNKDRPETTERHFSAPFQHNTWQNFPTQSPICTGNDEFSSRLDGITFSKWRNESIKAAGNAVVPQVVLQIFKAIEAYNKL
jgi:DNA (cytosine-5)-methyltransferase 1